MADAIREQTLSCRHKRADLGIESIPAGTGGRLSVLWSVLSCPVRSYPHYHLVCAVMVASLVLAPRNEGREQARLVLTGERLSHPVQRCMSDCLPGF